MSETLSPSLQSAVVAEAASWLADQKKPPRAAVPALKQRFGLSAVQACEAIKLASIARQHGTEKG